MLEGGEGKEEHTISVDSITLSTVSTNVSVLVHSLSNRGYLPCTLFQAAEHLYLDKNYYVGFCKKTPDGFKNLGAIQAGELTAISEQWERLKTFCYADCYWTVNSLYSLAPWKLKETQLNGFRRNKHAIKWLNCVWVDFDVGRPEDENPLKRISCETAIEGLFKMVESNTVPEPNIIAASGRGLYAIWLIDDGCGNPVDANWESKKLVENINRKLVEKLTPLSPDKVAIPVSQVIRFPGVVHSKTGNITQYFLRSGNRYSLGFLQDYFALGMERESRVKEYIIEPFDYKKPINPKSLKGVHALNRYYCDDILKIEKHLGGFKEGNRRDAMMTYAQCLQNSGVGEVEAVQLCEAMALRCDPPCKLVGQTTIKGLVKWVYSSKCIKFSAKAICLKFDVTSELAELLNLRSIVPPALKEKRSAKTKKVARDSFIKDCLTNNPRITANEISAACIQSGFAITRQHVGRLFRRWGVKAHKSGRPKNKTQGLGNEQISLAE